MQTTHFLVWVLFLTAIVGISLGAMLRAYKGAGSLSVLFTEPRCPLPPLPVPTTDPEAAAQFQRGCQAFLEGKYRQAVDSFNRAIQQDSSLAEAYHNLGLATANLRQDSEAAQLLLKAGELYLEQDNLQEFDRLKQDLEVLKAGRQASG